MLKKVFTGKVFLYFILFLVVLSIFLSSYFDKDNMLKMQAISSIDEKMCQEIEHDFIKESCLKSVLKQKERFDICVKKGGDCSRFY